MDCGILVILAIIHVMSLDSTEGSPLPTKIFKGGLGYEHRNNQDYTIPDSREYFEGYRQGCEKCGKGQGAGGYSGAGYPGGGGGGFYIGGQMGGGSYGKGQSSGGNVGCEKCGKGQGAGGYSGASYPGGGGGFYIGGPMDGGSYGKGQSSGGNVGCEKCGKGQGAGGYSGASYPGGGGGGFYIGGSYGKGQSSGGNVGCTACGGTSSLPNPNYNFGKGAPPLPYNSKGNTGCKTCGKGLLPTPYLGGGWRGDPGDVIKPCLACRERSFPKIKGSSDNGFFFKGTPPPSISYGK